MNKKQIGNFGEDAARRYLEDKGYEFVEGNYWCKAGEIDLVMKHEDTRVMVEVRLRVETEYGQGVDTVAWQKQRKLIRAAQWYQQEKEYWGDMRFDVISIELKAGGVPEIEHVEYAFEAG